jgi:aspartate beta-hydroxylase
MESAIEGKIFDKLNSFFDDYCLNSLQRAAALNFIKEKVANPEDSSVARVREWLLAQLNSKRIPPVHERQRGCPEIIPGLRANPWWDLSEFNWIEQVEAAYEDIRNELLALRNQGGFQPYRGPTWASSIQAADNVGSLIYMECHLMKISKSAQ